MFENMLSKLKSWWGVTFQGNQTDVSMSMDVDAPLLDPNEVLDPKADDPEPLGPDEAYAARNEILSKTLGVYLDLNGYYEMTEASLRDYEQSGLSDAKIQAGYEKALASCLDEARGVGTGDSELLSSILKDMAEYNMAKDPAWLASLPVEERKAAAEKYLAFENEHTQVGEDGKTQVYFGITAEEYMAMGETARAEYDAKVAACATTWSTSFGRAFDEFEVKPSVQRRITDEKDPSKPKEKAGFWATMTATVTGVAASVKSMMANSEIGKRIVAWFDGMKDRLDGFVKGKNDDSLIQPEEGVPQDDLAPVERMYRDDPTLCGDTETPDDIAQPDDGMAL